MKFIKHDEQPGVAKFRAEEDGVEVRHLHVYRSGTYIPQHAHKHSHLTVVAFGSVRVWLDGAHRGDYAAPAAIDIPAGTKHLFLTLAPDTVLECIHNVSRTREIEVQEEHEIVPGV